MVAATQTTLSRVLSKQEQLQVPLFQRHYQWDRKQWQDLWNDLARVTRSRASGDCDSTHFLGSVVVARPHSGSRGLLIVDGQQRLITLSLLLAALRDIGGVSASRRRVIDKALWLQSPKSGSVYRRLRVLPTEFDREPYARILSGTSELPAGRIAEAYKYFIKRIDELSREDAGEDDDEYVDVEAADLVQPALQGLEVVLVTAERGDNAHRIFESLNNTGMPLSQADLIRNYVLMRLDADQEDFYEFVFKPLEARFSPEELTQLFWLDLVLSGDDATQRQTYVSQQRRMERMSKTQIREHLEQMATRADSWARILSPQGEPSAKIRLRLERIRDWGTTTAAPTLLYLLEQRENGEATAAEVARAMRYLESYLVRRVVMGRATMNMNRVLMAAPAAMRKDSGPVDEALRLHLSGAGKHWATDEELRRNAATKPFFRHGKSHQRALILRWLEESLTGDDAEFALAEFLSIEHVMPQTLTEAWRAEIRAGLKSKERVNKIHGELVDTIGNLTLVTYKVNSALSNKPFAEKKGVLKARGGGKIELTKQVTSKHHWRPEAIRSRSPALVEDIIQNWPGPLLSDED